MRRRLLLACTGFAALGGRAFATPYKVTRTDAEWHALLTPAQYEILRRAGTEPPFSSALLNEHRQGVFHCAGCALPLFSSTTKFDSFTGWPSFYAPLPHAVNEQADRSFAMTRTEVHCSQCGGHLGHVFHDGPPPTGLRYCMNGLALRFAPA
ncbi:peptide-methionine (R)-S-oxide reductase MsrB [Acidocella sp.]|uniref:peptide-methionine (R)-S-oxide reductase MsrB n=1 Tax=Acidocella sp. TaxID=50710 RepID=UPI003CFF10AD